MTVLSQAFLLLIRPRKAARAALDAPHRARWLASALALSFVWPLALFANLVAIDLMAQEFLDMTPESAAMVLGLEAGVHAAAVACAVLVGAPALALVATRLFRGAGSFAEARVVIGLSWLFFLPVVVFVLPILLVALYQGLATPSEVMAAYGLVSVAKALLLARATSEAFRLGPAWKGLAALLIALALTLALAGAPYLALGEPLRSAGLDQLCLDVLTRLLM